MFRNLISVTLVMAFFTLTGFDAHAQTATAYHGDNDSAFLWRGLKHEWDSRNHRIGRLGSWVSMSGCDATGCDGRAHYAADSGIGPDSADYRTHYTALRSRYAAFQPGYRNIEVSGTEGSTIRGTIAVSVPMDENMRGHNHNEVFLNGFDLARVEGAKKLDRFQLRVKNPSTSGGSFNFEIEYQLRVDCDSAECIFDGNDVEYDLQVRYLMVAGDTGEFRVTRSSFEHAYEWDTSTETRARDFRLAETIEGGALPSSIDEFGDGTVGVRGFRINLDDDHWMDALYVRVINVDYDSSGNGSADFDLDVYFRQFHTPVPFGSFRRAGEAVSMKAWLGMLQFKSAMVDHGYVRGSVDRHDPHDSQDISF